MTKRLVTILLIAMLLASVMAPVLSASAMIGPQYVNTSNGKGVNMRTGPSKDSAIITTIPFGAMVDSYEYYNGTWGYVSYRGNYGYCMSRYFSSEKPAPRPSPGGGGGGGGSSVSNMFQGFAKADYYATVRPATPSGYVNLRWAPSKSLAVQGTYYAGYQLHIIAENSTWAQVYDENTATCGFMMRSFLSVTSYGYGAAN